MKLPSPSLVLWRETYIFAGERNGKWPSNSWNTCWDKCLFCYIPVKKHYQVDVDHLHGDTGMLCGLTTLDKKKANLRSCSREQHLPIAKDGESSLKRPGEDPWTGQVPWATRSGHQYLMPGYSTVVHSPEQPFQKWRRFNGQPPTTEDDKPMAH